MYGAWAAYDPVAEGTRLGSGLRQPAPPPTPANRRRLLAEKQEAISFAAYRAGLDQFPGDAGLFGALLQHVGFDPANTTADTSTPAGVGNAACGAVLAFRHHDGSNQLGDEPGGTPGVAYSDYTGFVPVDAPMAVGDFDPATVHDPSRWQPLVFPNAAGLLVTQTYVGPYWGTVVPFALHSGDQFRSATGPATFGTQQYLEQARDLLELPPGHWDLFAQFVARRDYLDLEPT